MSQDEPIIAKVARQVAAKRSGDLLEVNGITLNELGVKKPIVAAARNAAYILAGDKALLDQDYKLKFVDLIAERCKSAHQDFTFEAIQVLMSQVVILEALITRHSTLLAVADTDELMSFCTETILRAQGELRKTMLAIDQIKNPKKPTQFIKSYVHQQLNQLRTDLLETSHEQPIALPTGERPEAIRTDSDLDPVGEIDRTTVSSRKGKGRSKRLQG